MDSRKALCWFVSDLVMSGWLLCPFKWNLMKYTIKHAQMQVQHKSIGNRDREVAPTMPSVYEGTPFTLTIVSWNTKIQSEAICFE